MRSERGAAAGSDVDPPRLDDDRHDPPSTRQLEELDDGLRPLRHVDLAQRHSTRDELPAPRVAVWAARRRVEEDGRRRAHGISVPAMSVAAALNIPPRPWQSAIRQSATWRGPHSPRSWRTASTSVNI